MHNTPDMATLSAPLPAASRLTRLRRAPWKLIAVLTLLAAVPAWQTWTAPPWRMDQAQRAGGIDLVAADGTVFAHRGPRAPETVDMAKLPAQVKQAFVAIEDRRFYSHGPFDFRGFARAMWHNARAMRLAEGGSTITQQYVKNAYLSNDRTFARKFKEVFLADWAETWLTKDEILGSYLQHAYFGDQAWGLVAAAKHYFSKRPDQLTLGEAALLAGLVKAPSRLAPTNDYTSAINRMHVVLQTMIEDGTISPAQAAAVTPPRLRLTVDTSQARAGWFADWISAQAGDHAQGRVPTTVDLALQRRAEAVVRRAPLGGAEVALIALRPDGRVVALVGGRHWQPGAFDRAIQARRQPGSTFKLFDYFAAVRGGLRPDDEVLDAPLKVEDWRPVNGYPGFRGTMSVRDAFAISSNTAAVRVTENVGRRAVIKAARDLGVTSPLPTDPTLALGSGTMSLTELAGAYAAFAGGRYPVVPHGFAAQTVPPPAALSRSREWAPMLDLLWQAANLGTGRRAALAEPTFGKTGTSQDGRDALFVGFAGDLVTLVWIGRDDNKPLPGSSGGHLPAEIWRAFMAGVPLGKTDIPLPKQVTDPGGDAWPSAADIFAGFERIAAGIPPLVRGAECYVPDPATVERYVPDQATWRRYIPDAGVFAGGGAPMGGKHKHRKRR